MRKDAVAPRLEHAIQVPTAGLGRPVARAARQFVRNRSAVAGAVALGLVLAVAAIGPMLAPYSPTRVRVSERLRPPGAQHWLGTDQFGRDILSRILVGARPTVAAPMLAIGIGGALGTALGALAGYAGGAPDGILMRATEILQAFPGILLALIVITILGTGLINVMIAVGVSLIPVYARLVRGVMLAVRHREYVVAARAIGCSPGGLLTRHMLPNVWTQVAVLSTTALGWAIIAGSTLNFLGFGIRPPTPEWGADLNAGREYLNAAWWMSTAPGAAIVLIILAIHFVGDGLTEALDPALRG